MDVLDGTDRSEAGRRSRLSIDARPLHDDGYVVLPEFLPVHLVERLRREVDRWVDDGLRARSIESCIDPVTHGLPPLLEIELPAHGELVAFPPLLSLLAEILGPSFAFHHLHSDRQPPGLAGKSWHHDYEQQPQVSRTHAMVHALHYLDEVEPGDPALVILPGSHTTVLEKTALQQHGTNRLPGEVLLTELPPRTTVLIHSGVLHARRAPSRGAPRARYMIDASYCQVGVKWPPVKPYWRHILRRAAALGLTDDRWPHLFAEHHFDEYQPRA